MPSRDGLRREGVEDGKLRYFARILGFDPATGKKIIDTERKILAQDKADALKQRQAITAELVGKKIGTLQRGPRLRFSEAMDKYLATLTRHSTRQTYGSYGEKLKTIFGDRWLDKVPADEIQRYLNRLELAPPTVAGIKMVLLNLFNWALDEGHVVGPNPAAGIRLRRKAASVELCETEQPKKKGLSRDELPRYFDAHRELFPHTYPIVLSMTVLGTRYSEVSVLKRSDLDWTTGEVTIRRAHKAGRLGPPKGNKPRLAAFPLSAMGLLRAHITAVDESGLFLAALAESPWLFPRPDVWAGPRGRLPIWSYTTLHNHIKLAMLRAGVRTDNATHFARHTLNGLMRGQVTDAVLRSVVGHSSEAMNLRYGDAEVMQFAEVVEQRLRLSPGEAAPDEPAPDA